MSVSEYQKQYDKERYEWLKEKHICVMCKREKAEKGKVYCLICKMDKREKEKNRILSEQQKEQKRIHNKRRYDILVAFGICPRCGFRENKYNSIFCARCSNKRNLKAKNRRIENGRNCKRIIWNNRLLLSMWKKNNR